MKKIFEFGEILTHVHNIEVDVRDEQDQEFEDFADEVAEKIEEDSTKYSREDIVNMFNQKYGSDNVVFCEDGSPEVEYEGY